MKFNKSVFYLLLWLLGAAGSAQAQGGQNATLTGAFADEITAFRHLDSVQMPPAGAVLFAGSSSIRKWKKLQQSFPGYTIINRGFGGATLLDLIRYTPYVIAPYKPRQILIYCGENDLASEEAPSPETVAERVKTLYALIRTKYPNTQTDYISIKPSPSRKHLQAKVAQTNGLIEAWLKSQPHTRFINIYPAMLNPDGSIKEELFIGDRLHLNGKGYARWARLITPFLLPEK